METTVIYFLYSILAMTVR